MHLLPRSIALALSVEDGHSRTPSDWSVDRAYWLAHCDGYRVDGPGGQIGVVDHAEYGPQTNMPEAILVASGLWRIHYTRFPVTDVVDVRPDQERIILGGSEASEQFGDGRRAPDIVEARYARHEHGSDHRCADCGHGVTITRQQLRCPMCGATAWEKAPR